jgi:hypothetical protein
MRRVSMATRDKLIATLAERYSEFGADRERAHPRRVCCDHRVSPQARDACAADRTDGGAARTTAGAPAMARRSGRR